MFKDIYNKKKILITGNTGFKGSWLTAWLIKLGANIVGISKDIPTTLAPKLIISRLSQLPLKPVWPVIKTVFILTLLLHDTKDLI